METGGGNYEIITGKHALKHIIIRVKLGGLRMMHV